MFCEDHFSNKHDVSLKGKNKLAIEILNVDYYIDLIAYVSLIICPAHDTKNILNRNDVVKIYDR